MMLDYLTEDHPTPYKDVKPWDSVMLDQTSPRYPEQYDAFLNGVCIGSLRLSNGRFSVRNEEGEVLVYYTGIYGNGEFDTTDERAKYLNKGRKVLFKSIRP